MQDFRCSLLEGCRTSSVQSEMLCPDAHASPWIGTATSYIVIPLVSYTRRTAPSSLVLMLYTKSLNWNLPVMVFFTFIQRALRFEEIPHNTRSPIGGRIRDAPKARCGPREFHCNLSRSHQPLLH